MRASRIGLFVVLGVATALPAWAFDVFVNGERVTGVQNLTLQNPTSVRFDAEGNVFIDAPGYRVNAVMPSPAPAIRPGATSIPDARVRSLCSKRYFLVTDTNAPGLVQYDVAVTINGQVVRRIESNEEQVILDVTEYLRPGQNSVAIAAFKDLAGGRRSQSNGHVFRVLIGEGRDDRGHVTLENQQVVFVVDASQTNDMSRPYTLSAR